MKNLIRLRTIGILIYFMVIVISVIYLDIKLLIVEGSKFKEMKILDIITIRILDLKMFLS